MTFTGAALYRFAPFDDPAALRQPLLDVCAARGVKGTLLLAATVLGGVLVALFYGRDLNIVSLGRRSSDALGVDTVKQAELFAAKRLEFMEKRYVLSECQH